MTATEAIASAIRDVAPVGGGVTAVDAYRLHAHLLSSGWCLIPTQYPDPDFTTEEDQCQPSST